MKLSNNQKAVLALIVANIIWGAAAPIFKWSLFDIGPYTLAFLRFFLAALILFPFAKNSLKIKSKDYLNVFIMALFGVFVNIAFFFKGLQLAPSINAAIIGSAGPVFLVLFSFLFTKEKPKIKMIIGTLIGLLGILIFFIEPFFDAGGLNYAIGNLLLLLATFGAIIHTMIGRQVIKRNNFMAVVFWMFLIGSLFFLPFFVKEVGRIGFLPNLTFQSLIGIFFGAVFSSLIAYLLHGFALRSLTASDVGVFTYLDPVVTILIAYPLLGEIPDAVFIIGSALVFGGIFIAEGRIHYHPLSKLFKG